ncbi:hypothetical protein ACOMHN_047562 [Nucella lapillus]
MANPRRLSPSFMLALWVILFSVNIVAQFSTSFRRHKPIRFSFTFFFLCLCLAVGVVLFISAISDELGYHAQTTGHSPKDFSYHYGWSFYVAGSAFVSSELSAVMCITLYLRHNARVQDMVRIIPGLETKLEEDVESGEPPIPIPLPQESPCKAGAAGASLDVIW